MTLKHFRKNFAKIEEGLRKKRVVVVKGGFSEEREASFYSGEKVAEELLKNGFEVVKLDPSEQNLLDTVRAYRDIVFNCLHGDFGESGHLPAILDYLKVPYTFSGVKASALTLDKLYFKCVLKKLGFSAAVDNFDKDFALLKGQFIHKKINGGGSLGMTIDQRKVTVPGFITEQFIDGKILSIGVLECGGDYQILEPVEIKLQDKKFYDTDAKYNEEASLVQYNGPQVARIKSDALRLFEILGIKGAARADLIVDAKHFYFLEVNSVPGLYGQSNLAFSAKLKGLSFYQLLIWLLNAALY